MTLSNTCKKCRDVERVMIVTDHAMVELGFLDRIIEQLDLRRNKVVYQIFADVEPDPDITTVERGTEIMRTFKPDTIIALGGGSPMDAAKVMWLFYEQPEVDFRDLVQKFMDIRKRAFKFPLLGKKTKFIAIPTTSGTGSEVTPFAVISDKANNRKYPIADYSLTPTVAIVDPALVLTVPGFCRSRHWYGRSDSRNRSLCISDGQRLYRWFGSPSYQTSL